MLVETDFVQTLAPTGEYGFQFDNDEIFNVDLEGKKVRWRLPQFGDVAGFDAAGALQSMNIDKLNFKISVERSNYTKAKNGKTFYFIRLYCRCLELYVCIQYMSSV